jgi:hypothetical protein
VITQGAADFVPPARARISLGSSTIPMPSVNMPTTEIVNKCLRGTQIGDKSVGLKRAVRML